MEAKHWGCYSTAPTNLHSEINLKIQNFQVVFFPLTGRTHNAANQKKTLEEKSWRRQEEAHEGPQVN